MYEYKKRTSKIKRIIISLLLITISSVLSIFIYNIYINVGVYSNE